MKTLISLTTAMTLIGALAPKACFATESFEKRVLIQHDVTYEQALKYEASADKTITPTKVLRWVKGLRGQALSAPSPAEFQPIVNVNESHVRVIASIAYKF